ncbi:MAG: DUF4870 domain-containing protein [Chloroflexota bacterium]
MWLTERDKSEMIDQHGKMVTNWIIMSTILSVVTFVLAFLFIGFFMIPLLLIACVVFPIMGAVRANEGRLWQYPFTPNFVG